MLLETAAAGQWGQRGEKGWGFMLDWHSCLFPFCGLLGSLAGLQDPQKLMPVSKHQSRNKNSIPMLSAWNCGVHPPGAGAKWMNMFAIQLPFSGVGRPCAQLAPSYLQHTSQASHSTAICRLNAPPGSVQRVRCPHQALARWGHFDCVSGS